MERLINILNKINFSLDLGMFIEVEDFLKESISIKNFKIKKENNKYILKIKLKKYSYNNAEKHFDQFMKFIRYSFLNMYFFNKEDNFLKITYFTIYKTNEEYFGTHFEIEYF